MASRTAHIVAQFDARTQNYTRAVNFATKATRDFAKEAQRSGKSMLESTFSWKKATIAVTGFYLTIRKLIKVLTEFSDASSRAQEIQQKFDIVFRDNRREAQEWANELANSYNRSSTEVEKFAAQLQNTFVPLGFARKEASELSKTMVELAMDLSSFNDIPMARVVTDIQSALMGNVRAVRKYGVSANETRIFQEALSKGLIKQKNELDAVSKAYSINNIILESTRDAHGDLQRTMHQTANVTRAYNETLTRSKELTGDYVNIVLTPLKKWLTEVAQAWNTVREARNAYMSAFKGGDIDLAIAESERIIKNLEDRLDLLIDYGVQSTSNATREAQHYADMISDEKDRLKFLKDRRHEEQKLINNANAEEELTERINALDVARTKILEDLQEKLRQNIELEKISVKNETEYERQKEDAKAVQEAINALIATGLTNESYLISIVNSKYGERFKILQEYLDRLAEEKKLKKEIQDKDEEIFNMYKTRASNMSIIWGKMHQDASDAVKASAEEMKQAWESVYMGLPNMVAGVFNNIASIISALGSKEIELLNYNAEQAKKIREEEYEDKIAKLEAEVIDKYDRDLAIEALDEEFAEAEKSIAEDLELQKRKLQYETALNAWKLQLNAVIAGGGGAQMQAWQLPWPANLVASLAAATATGIQTALVIANKPQKLFQTGIENFTVPEGFSNDSFGIGLSSGESVTVRTPTEQINDVNSGSDLNFSLIWNDTEVGRYTGKLIQNRKLKIYYSDIINK